MLFIQSFLSFMNFLKVIKLGAACQKHFFDTLAPKPPCVMQGGFGVFHIHPSECISILREGSEYESA